MERVDSKRKRDKQLVSKVAEISVSPELPPSHSAERTVTLRVGPRRYEMRFYSEVREVRNGPARIIQLPVRAPEIIPNSDSSLNTRYLLTPTPDGTIGEDPKPDLVGNSIAK